MTREQAINYLYASGMSEKQVDTLVGALEKDILDKIRAEIEKVKVIMNEEIIEHDRKDLINFTNGINQCLVIIDKYRG